MSIRSFKQLFSILFAVVLLGFGVAAGLSCASWVAATPTPNGPRPGFLIDLWASFIEWMKVPAYSNGFTAALGGLGALLGVIFGPKIAQSVVDAGNALEQLSTREKVAVILGVFFGVILTVPFFVVGLRVPSIGVPVAILVLIAFVYLGVRAAWSMKDEFRFISGPVPVGPDGSELSMDHCKILDTNVIIDGRISDICRTGFVEGPIYVPGFVLDELQHIADSSDSLKRARGRRGLDILNAMQKELPLIVRSYDHKLGGGPHNEEVDSKLVRLAKNIGGKIVTNDFNLNKVAALQGVSVLNVNELANALKPVVLPGEEMGVLIIKEGKEQNQGVAYLDDGTMVVVEDGRRHLGDHKDVIVTSVLQTVAGKMIFARIKGEMKEEEDGHNVGPRNSGGRSRFKVR